MNYSNIFLLTVEEGSGCTRPVLKRSLSWYHVVQRHVYECPGGIAFGLPCGFGGLEDGLMTIFSCSSVTSRRRSDDHTLRVCPHICNGIHPSCDISEKQVWDICPFDIQSLCHIFNRAGRNRERVHYHCLHPPMFRLQLLPNQSDVPVIIQ
jgi:hypothetical protein